MQRGHLARVQGSTRVSLSPVKNMIAGYFVARLDVLVGRVLEEVGEIFRLLRAAVLGGPEPAHLESSDSAACRARDSRTRWRQRDRAAGSWLRP